MYLHKTSDNMAEQAGLLHGTSAATDGLWNAVLISAIGLVNLAAWEHSWLALCVWNLIPVAGRFGLGLVRRHAIPNRVDLVVVLLLMAPIVNYLVWTETFRTKGAKRALTLPKATLVP